MRTRRTTDERKTVAGFPSHAGRAPGLYYHMFWGWNRRDSSGNHDTEFFYFLRSLRFRQAEAVLRNHLVKEINKFFARCSINARVRPVGFPTEAEIGELIEKALTGSVHYAEAFRVAGECGRSQPKSGPQSSVP